MYHVSMYDIYIYIFHASIYIIYIKRNLQIVGNKKLKILSKGPRYWQPKPIKLILQDCIIKRTERYIPDWYFKNGYNTQALINR